MTRQMEKLYSVDHSRGNGSSESRLALNDNDSMQISLQRQMEATPTGRHIVQFLEHSNPEDGKQMQLSWVSVASRGHLECIFSRAS